MTPASESENKRSIVLVGYRGCGKTTVGRELAVLLGGAYVDSDELVASLSGKSVAILFAEEGESGFRRRERAAIEKIVANPAEVISVGGGAVLDARNVKALRSIAAVVWLTAPAAVLWGRMASDPGTESGRPRLTEQTGLAEVESVLTNRAPLYEAVADLIIATTDKTPREIALEIGARLFRRIE